MVCTVEVYTTDDRSFLLDQTFKSRDYAATFLQGAASRGVFLPAAFDTYVNAKFIVSFVYRERRTEAE